MKFLPSLQRKLIYRPVRETSIPLHHAETIQGDVEEIWLQSHDDIKLHGWHLKPDGKTQPNENGPKGVLFLSGNSSNRRFRTPQFEIFLELGLEVICFDYRGYGENTGKPNEKAIREDVRDYWSFLLKQTGFSPEEILICGQSLGGAIATRLASELCAAGTIPGGLILSSTFTNLADAASRHYPWLPVRKILVEEYHSDERIQNVTCPLIFFHGKQDTIVCNKLGRQLYHCAEDFSWNGVPKRFVELPTAGHNNILKTEREAYFTGLKHFIHNLVPPPDSAVMMIPAELQS